MELDRLFRYDAWANRETSNSLARARPDAPAAAVRLLAHIAATQRLWWGRIQGSRENVVVWPTLTIQQCVELFEQNAALYLNLLANPFDAARAVRYVSSQYGEWSSSVDEILTHVVTHGVYHRGQIAAELRANGFEPAYTDLIHATRTGAVPA